MRIRDVVRFDGAMTADTAMLLPLREAQRLYGKPGLVKGIAVSNRGSGDAAVALSDAVVRTLKPVVTPLGLETSTVKADAIDMADKAGNAFMSLFTTFGTFSISAGILLIFLIFVMLAAERRGELGIARAVGTRRGHLVQMFTFEGAAYDLIAAAVGAILGALVAYAMVLGIASAFGAADEDAGLQVQYAVTFRSLFVAFAIGGLLTLLVVAFSAWRVSVMTISTAIRNLPEPQVPHRRRRFVLALTGIGLGALLTASGAGSASATALMLGISLILIGLVPILRLIGVSERLAYTSCGLAIAVAMLLPWSVWESVFGQISMDFSTWIVSGLMTVIGAVWVLVYNADLILRAVSYVLSRFGSVAPVCEDGDHLPAAGALPDGRDARDVHARRLHARHRDGVVRLVPESVRRTPTSSAEASRSGRAPRRRPRSRTCRLRSGRRPASTRRASPRSGASRCSR